MAEGVLFNIAEEILKNLGSRALDEIAAAWGFKPRLERLKNTIETVKNLLLDAQDRQVQSHAIRGWLLRLQAILYDADDLFDEFSTVASKKKDMEGNKLTNNVRIFFSHSNPIVVSFTISQQIKRIREDLDAIVKDGGEFQFVLRPTEEGWVLKTGQHRGETGYFVHTQDVIGREADKNAILEILLSSSNCTVSIVPIVGMGGLGKTTLAQLLYNDKIVEQHFELLLWVCVGEVFDEKEIVKKILMSATEVEPQNLGMGQLQSRLRQSVGGRKYLLVLDDVWNEHREKWVKVSDLLKDGKEDSKILVTTRSTRVAKIMGTVPAYLLGGLSPEKSWDLFQKVAFEPGQKHKNPHLVEIGKEILKMCGNVPLAIRTLGSLLYGQDERKWLSIKECGSLAKISEDGDDIMPILKLSYNHLTSALKHCFAYCALFPKDYVFQKEKLISLWMAEGFLLPKNGSQRQHEDVGEDYFAILVQRCFFHDIEENKWGNIESCKVHDLLHDLAHEVCGAESIVARFEDSHLDKGIRHLSLGYRMKSTQSVPSCMLDLKLLRTFLLPEQVKDGSAFCKSMCSRLILSFRCLRVLDLNNLGVEILPSSICKLIHLRYLNLSHNPIRTLPSSITDLQNLQTLNFFHCWLLRTLPKDIRKLINLTNLDVGECMSLTHMPQGMGALTCLHKLNYFVVKGEDPSGPRSGIGRLRDLKNLNRLKGQLLIKLSGDVREPLIEAKEANLSSKHGVIDLYLKGYYYIIGNVQDKEIKHDEAILEGLKPHPNLKKLEIGHWRGEKLPSWALMDNLSICLPNLVHIGFVNLYNWQELPSFGQLKFLKHLSFYGLMKVEYIENSPCLLRQEVEQGSSSLFFPSLEFLQLQYMDSLKGWWKHGREEEKTTESWMSFPNVSRLNISGCPKLKLIPMCPNVKELELVDVNEELTETVLKMASKREKETASLDGSSSSSSSRSKSSGSAQLKTLKIDNVQHVIRLPKECLQHLSSLTIYRDKEVESIETLEQVLKTSLPCLHQLSFIGCDKLKRVAPGLQHLTALEHLCFIWCDSLEIEEEANEIGMPWKALNNNLRTLTLFSCNLKYVPEGIKHLTNLSFLSISENMRLKEIPEWIGCLSSLHTLHLNDCKELKCLPDGVRRLTNLKMLDISNCPDLEGRCKAPTGQDWTNIQHIPLVVYGHL